MPEKRRQLSAERVDGPNDPSLSSEAMSAPESSPHPLALPAAEGDVFELTEALMLQGCEAARQSPRRRMIFPIHRQQDARVQRMLNFMQPETYVRPHRHPLEHATESIQLLRGELGCLIFDGEGEVISTHHLKADAPVAFLDLEPGLWHGMVVLAPDTVLLEIKHGPYRVETDKEFAPWAPEEGDLEAVARAESWRLRFPLSS